MKLLQRLWGASPRSPQGGARTASVGWFLEDAPSSVIYEAPQRIEQKRLDGASSRAVEHCPAIRDLETRLFEIPCPYDLELEIRRQPDGSPKIVDRNNGKSGVSANVLAQLLHPMDMDTWRTPDRPVFQLVTPYRFVSDDHVYLNQLPPFGHYTADPWPGLVLGGRFPIDIWPRQIMWAFEWHDQSRPVVLKRGEPWFYLRFEATMPETGIRMVQAARTPELLQYCRSIDGVTGYVNRTYSLFDTARKRRPERLLVEDRPEG